MARTRTVLLRLATFAAALSLFTGTGLAGDDGPVEVAKGLDNPRHLSFGPFGDLYVAEAGKGGTGPCVTGGEDEEVCYGPTGAITMITWDRQRRVVTGLPSVAGADGSATGPHDVGVAWDGSLYATIGLGANPALTAPGGALAGLDLGTLMKFRRGDRGGRVVADLAAYEGAANPDGVEPPDSNPYGLLLRYNSAFVTDAGGNSLLRVGPRSDVTTRAVFPQTMVPAPPFLGLPPGATIPMDAVPTSVARSPQGGLYVGQLTGFPFPAGGASVFEVARDGTHTVFASGFTNIVDIEFGRDGSLYVVELSSAGLLSDTLDGALIRVRPDGTRTSVPLFAPGGVAVDWRGKAYVSVCSVCAGGGAVVKVSI